ncbi:hypothetical protein ACFC09_14080 [Streptomyces sp. NPDC056161]
MIDGFGRPEEIADAVVHLATPVPTASAAPPLRVDGRTTRSVN